MLQSLPGSLISLRGDALCQIPGFVYVQPLGQTEIIAHQLQGNHRKTGGKVGAGFWDIHREISGVFNAVVAADGQTHQVSPPALDLRHIAGHLLIQLRLGRHADHQTAVFNEGNGAVLQLAGYVDFAVSIIIK